VSESESQHATSLSAHVGWMMLIRRSHGWRWVDRSGWSEGEEVENVRQAITGEQRVGA
jgi:hypothetical protein